MKEKKYIRYGVQDLVLTEEENKQFLKSESKYASIVDSEGNHLDSLEIFWVADEDEDGNEIDEEESEVE